jgi:thioredoxin-related protein
MVDGMSFLKKYNGKLVVLSHKLCSACQELKEKLKDEKDVVFLDVREDEDARTLAEALNVEEVPTMMEVFEEDGEVKVCLLDDSMNVKECYEVGEEG